MNYHCIMLFWQEILIFRYFSFFYIYNCIRKNGSRVIQSKVARKLCAKQTVTLQMVSLTSIIIELWEHVTIKMVIMCFVYVLNECSHLWSKAALCYSLGYWNFSSIRVTPLFWKHSIPSLIKSSLILKIAIQLNNFTLVKWTLCNN